MGSGPIAAVRWPDRFGAPADPLASGSAAAVACMIGLRHRPTMPLRAEPRGGAFC